MASFTFGLFGNHNSTSRLIKRQIQDIHHLLFHIDYTKDDKHTTMAATRAILADKMTIEIDNKIFELSKLIDKNADCLNSKSDQFQ